jgi:hypothetical protein
MKLRKSILLLASVAVLIVSATAAATASASPAWKFNTTELAGNETIVGAAISSKLTIPGVTTICSHFLYNMKVSNNAEKKGTGEITELPLFECYTEGSTCTVSSIEAKKLNWPTHLVTVAGKNYIFVEKVEVEIRYAGAECAFKGLPIIVKGTAGGVVENSTETAEFNKTTFTATGAVLKVGATQIEWNGLFPTEAFEKHREEKLEVS